MMNHHPHHFRRPIGNGKTQQMAWKVDGTHVYPVNDNGIVVHNSLDGREMYERGERKPS
jgi:hypothetical protein